MGSYLLHSILFTVLFNLGNVYCWPTFRFYSNPSDLTSFIALSSNNIQRSGFDVSKETKFLIHGFGDNGDITNMRSIKDALLKKGGYNVIIVDWEKGAAGPNYWAARSNCPIVGQRVIEFMRNNTIDPRKVHCIGHSLGAHACGFAGKLQKLRRISGLDPAGPEFTGKPKDQKLDKSDADFVDVIHTDAQFGTTEILGHKDFFPNGGLTQPSCRGSKRKFNDEFDRKFDIVGSVACSHLVVPFYYAESILTDCFQAAKCSKYFDFLTRDCGCSKGDPCSSMGFYSDESGPDGVYYLTVNSKTPFCKQ